MCGICGIISKKNINQIDREVINHMNAAQKHRGPDDEGTYFRDQVALGHRRLSILDLSSAGHQPMSFNGKYVISFNGEIYNYIELREELSKKGYCFLTDTDTEIIMASYDFWGADCLKKFNGFWSFAVYEIHTGKLFLSRDRLGVKPLYYYKSEDKVIFASEIKALLCDKDVPRTSNSNVIIDFLINGIVDYSDETFFEKIYKLPAGCYMTCDKNMKIEMVKYFDINFSYECSGRLTDNQVKEFRRLFNRSIELRLRSDVPVGSCLSGGLDSSSIVCHVNSILRDSGNKGRINTFSACYENFEFDESDFIGEVVKDTDALAHYVYPTEDMLKKDLDDLIFTQEELNCS